MAINSQTKKKKMSLLNNIEDGIKKGFRIQYELGRLSETRLNYSSSGFAETETEQEKKKLALEIIDKRIAKFQGEMDLLDDFFEFTKK